MTTPSTSGTGPPRVLRLLARHSTAQATSVDDFLQLSSRLTAQTNPDRDAAEAFLKAILASEGAGSPFFSADGAWIGFWADGRIKKMRADGGPIMDVCATSPAGGDQKGKRDRSINGEIVGASWGSDDTIVFALP